MRLALISIAFIISFISLMSNKNSNSTEIQMGLENDSIELPIYKVDSCVLDILYNTLSKDSLCNF